MIRENGPEQVETLLQSVLADVLLQHLVVLADGCQEHDQQDVLKTVDPLPPFAPLPTHVNLGREIKLTSCSQTPIQILHFSLRLSCLQLAIPCQLLALCNATFKSFSLIDCEIHWLKATPTHHYELLALLVSKVVLNHPSGLHSHLQDVLVLRYEGGVWDPVYVSQEISAIKLN